jgi:hypothetical protein
VSMPIPARALPCSETAIPPSMAVS